MNVTFGQRLFLLETFKGNLKLILVGKASRIVDDINVKK